MAKRTGLWLVGARGSVATTATLGLAAMRRGLAPTTGLVTELPAFSSAELIGWGNLVLGGHEVRPGSLVEASCALGFSPALVEACHDDLVDIDSRIVPGVLHQSGPAVDCLAAEGAARQYETPREAVAAIRADLTAFRETHDLDRVVVVLVASTEPPTDESALPATWDELSRTLDSTERCPLRASSLYAIAALGRGHSFVNFTPSLGSSCTALDDLAKQRGACHAGRDGKTGETLLKTVLAPLFASRNLEVMSWVGHNILGNADGRVLDSVEHKSAKLGSKDTALRALLRDDLQTLTSIEYLPSLGEHKTAWNHVHFRGFMGVEMTLQFTLQGHDSALAGPLVLDLARLVDASAARGETGALGQLASFFKQPYGARLAGHTEHFDQLLGSYCVKTE